MDNNDRYNQFILKLINQTKNKEIEWKYLADDLVLEKDLQNSKAAIPKNYDTDQSFYFLKGNSYVTILTTIGRYAKTFLLIVPSTFRQIKTIDDDEYTANLTRLLENIKRCFPNPEDFIDEFLES